MSRIIKIELDDNIYDSLYKQYLKQLNDPIYSSLTTKPTFEQFLVSLLVQYSSFLKDVNQIDMNKILESLSDVDFSKLDESLRSFNDIDLNKINESLKSFFNNKSEPSNDTTNKKTSNNNNFNSSDIDKSKKS